MQANGASNLAAATVKATQGHIRIGCVGVDPHCVGESTFRRFGVMGEMREQRFLQERIKPAAAFCAGRLTSGTQNFGKAGTPHESNSLGSFFLD
jgi:hypothetical protein